MNNFTITVDFDYLFEWEVVHAYYTNGAPSSSLLMVPTTATQKKLYDLQLRHRFIDQKLVILFDQETRENILQLKPDDFNFDFIFYLLTENKEIVHVSDISIQKNSQIKLHTVNLKKNKIIEGVFDGMNINKVALAQVFEEPKKALYHHDQPLKTLEYFNEGYIFDKKNKAHYLVSNFEAHPIKRPISSLIINGQVIRQLLSQEDTYKTESRIDKRTVYLRYRIQKRNKELTNLSLKGKSAKEFHKVEESDQSVTFESVKEFNIKDGMRPGESLELWAKKNKNNTQLRKKLPSPSTSSLTVSSKEGIWAFESIIWV